MMVFQISLEGDSSWRSGYGRRWYSRLPRHRFSDNDGIPESIRSVIRRVALIRTETARRTSEDTDSDNDGIPDSAWKADSTGGPDTDGDGTPDFQDTDSVITMAFQTLSKVIRRVAPDTDGDGTPDFRDTDSDDDGLQIP